MAQKDKASARVGEQAVQAGAGVERISGCIVDIEEFDMVAMEAAATKGVAHASIERLIGDKRADTEENISTTRGSIFLGAGVEISSDCISDSPPCRTCIANGA